MVRLPGFLPGIFFKRGAKSIVMQISLLFYCFWTKFQGGAKSPKGGQTASGGRPPARPMEESQCQCQGHSVVLMWPTLTGD